MKGYDQKDPQSVVALFDSIASRYDLGNAINSGNLHRLWNRRLVRAALQNSPQEILDLCAGTGEIAKGMYRKKSDANYHLVDFSKEMLEIAKKRLPHPNVSFYHENAEKMSFSDAQFDAATCAYGIRNVYNRAACFSEIFRVLKPGGVVCILELTRPEGAIFGALHKLYLRTVLPVVGKLIASDGDAYRYLCNTIESFVPVADLRAEIAAAGFCNIETHTQTFGIATIITGQKS